MPLRRLSLTCCLLFSLPTGAQETADYWLTESDLTVVPAEARPALLEHFIRRPTSRTDNEYKHEILQVQPIGLCESI